ncbi:DNA-directed DNA polymerase [Malassezia pachydermatis]
MSTKQKRTWPSTTDTRRALQTFYEQSRDQVTAVYLVHGHTNEKDMSYTLVSEDALPGTSTPARLTAATRDALTSPTWFVYALQPGAHAAVDAPYLASIQQGLARDPAYAAQRANGLAAFGAVTNTWSSRGTAAPPQPMSAATGPAPASTGAGKKRRKVIKQVRIKNERGYMVTKDVETYESGSDEDTPSVKPAAAPTTASTPAAAAPAKPKRKGTAAKQQNLMSFFTKKS